MNVEPTLVFESTDGSVRVWTASVEAPGHGEYLSLRIILVTREPGQEEIRKEGVTNIQELRGATQGSVHPPYREAQLILRKFPLQKGGKEQLPDPGLLMNLPGFAAKALHALLPPRQVPASPQDAKKAQDKLKKTPLPKKART